MFDRWELRGDVLYADVMVGIPLLGRTGFGETAFLKLLGDLRWRHLTHLCDVDTRELVDVDGSRLYGSFYFVEIRCPDGQSFADIGENDELTIVNTLESDGGSLLDGYHLLYPRDWPDDRKVPLANGEAALAAGVPYAHTSNAFVKMVQGASWLKKGAPSAETIGRVPSGSGAQDTYRRVTLVSGGTRTWRSPPATYDRLTPAAESLEYVPDADRDVNGLGLLYFANYPAVLDVIERRVLAANDVIPLGDDLLDLRSIAHRQSAYIANLVPPDVIDVSVEAWIANPFRAGVSSPEVEPVRLFMNYEMTRRSDGRKMLVSSADKVLHGVTADDSGFLAALERLAATAEAPAEASP